VICFNYHNSPKEVLDSPANSHYSKNVVNKYKCGWANRPKDDSALIKGYKITLPRRNVMKANTTAVRKVLVIDDDPVVAKSLNRVLTGKGYAVITAASGEEAMFKLKEEKYDLVYTDIKMPGMSGIEVTKQVKASQPWLPVVVITGYGSDQNISDANEAGAVEILHKPLSPEMIEQSAEDAFSLKEEVVDNYEVPQPVIGFTKNGSIVKTAAMMIVGPLLALVAVVLGPIAGLFALAYFGMKALAAHFPKTYRNIKNVSLFFLSPFIGLAYLLTFPMVGAGIMAYTGYQAWKAKK
jgi:CheY-like chemotaxis protein